MPTKLRRREPLALTRARVVLVVMRKAQIAEVIEVTTRRVTVNVRKLPALRREIAVDAETERASTAGGNENLCFDNFARTFSHAANLIAASGRLVR